MDKADRDDSTPPDSGDNPEADPAASRIEPGCTSVPGRPPPPNPPELMAPRSVPAVTRAPPPVRSISGSCYVPANPPSAPLVRYVPPAPPGFPGWVFFSDAHYALADKMDEWTIPPERLGEWPPPRDVAQGIEEELATGRGRAAGIHSSTGIAVWAPRETWRMSRTFKGRREYATWLAMQRQTIRFPLPGRWGSFECEPFLSCRTLALAFGAKTPPDDPPQSTLDCIREVEVRSRKDSQAEPPPAKGGRKPSQDMWQPFWIEVSQWAAANDLVPVDECRPRLRRHMLSWAAEPSTTSRPSEASIDRALSDLFASVALKTRLEGK